MNDLPIYEVINDIKSNLISDNIIILEAPPGAGKSTIVPISLLDEPWLGDKMIIMLEPRRVAARMTAARMAELLGEEVGKRVGYIIKNDSCRGKDTKILVVTEAVLVRMLQSDQSLEDTALIIFDEFHERSIYTDLSFALSKQVGELLRDDLKLMVMSATLNSSKLLQTIGEVPVITSRGKLYPIEDIYLPKNIKQPDSRTLTPLITSTILGSIEKDTGDILVFLRGTKEIKNIHESLEQKGIKEIDICPLYSNLPKKEQDRALRGSNKRKVILSTNIAQTSLTIEGVKVVIDTGIEKVSRFNYATGMDHLEEMFISADSAIQRAGRAGRLSAGKCYKLWHSDKILTPHDKPEILRADLSSLLLELSQWGVDDLEELCWLDIPNSKLVKEARVILQELMMLNKNFNITNKGIDTIKLGVHPRLGSMILKGYDLGLGFEACILAALIESKDIFKSGHQNSSLLDRFEVIFQNSFDKSYVNNFLAKEVLKSAGHYFKRLCSINGRQTKNSSFDNESIALLALFAYPDRLAGLRKKDSNIYKLSSGKGAMLNYDDNLFGEKLLVVTTLNASNQNSYINHAVSIGIETIKENFTHLLEKKRKVTYNKTNKKFDVKEYLYFLELELESYPVSADDLDFKELLLSLIKEEGLELLPWSKKALELKERVNFINYHKKGSFADLSDSMLIDTLDTWLKPYLDNIRSVKELEDLDIYNILLGMIPWEDQQSVDKLAPAYLKVPSGSKIKIDYTNLETPVLKVKIQEVFGLNNTPKILDGSLSLQLHLLSPASRPIQITYDLKSFWDNSYEEVAKELRGKYKKHYWPANPYEAAATNKTKKYMDKNG